MIEADSTKNSIMSIMGSIFNSIDDKILPIIYQPEEIPSIIRYLTDDSNAISNKLQLLSILNLIFIENKMLIIHFINKCRTENCNLIESIINIYLSENIENENKKIIENILSLIMENITLSKSIFEFIYQKLSYYYIGDNITKIKEEFLLKSYRLLQIFYNGMDLSSEELQNENNNNDTSNNDTNSNVTSNSDNNSKYVIINNNKTKDNKEGNKEIRKYIYFNGKGSSLCLSLNKNSINLNSHFPTLENGCSVLFWTYLDKKLTSHYFDKYKDLKVYLVTINIAGHQIRLLFENLNTFKIEVDENTSNAIDIDKKFKYNSWNNICFEIEKKKITMVKVIINGDDSSVSYIFPKNIPINEPIDTIKLFDNFFGKVSTVMLFSFSLNIQMIKIFKAYYKQGFYKNKYLFKFLNSNDEDYFSNSPEYNYCQKFKNNAKTNNSSKAKLFKIKLKENNIKNLISCFVPFTYDKTQNIIDDVFGNFIGILGNNDGANNYINYLNAIDFLGGINNLLPLAEMMFINKDILNENTFYEYLLILQNILIGHTKNLLEANKNKFFSNLGLFLEKYPPGVYSNKILDILLNIGKEAFRFSDDKFSSSNDNFVNMILLNEKIFSKFTPKNQSKLWEGVYQFFISDHLQMRESLNISKICLLLRFYDEKKYEEYCCKRHADLFNVKFENNIGNNNISAKDELKIMNPEMNEKIDKLFDIIILYFNKFYKEKEIVNLYKLLSLDLSPCLQKKIIQAYINYFENKTSTKEKVITLENLLKNNFLEITEYVLSISLLDVRIEVLKLFKLLLQNNSNTIKTYISNNNANNINPLPINSYNNNINNNNFVTLNSIITNDNNNKTPSNICTSLLTIYMFICENLLPERLLVELDNNNQNNNKGIKATTPLDKYFNKNFYEQDKCCLWTLLDMWFASKDAPINVGGNKVNSKIRLNGYALDFCIHFISSDVPIYFIDSFIKSLNSYINDNMVTNRDVIFENKNIYPWLIETLFYFYNKENAEAIGSKEMIDSVQKNSLKLYNILFSNKKFKEDFGNRINYLFEYSYYMKKLFKNDKQKLKEISNITRLLLEKLIEFSSINEINKKSQVYFDFMFLYRNNEEKLYKTDNNGYDSNINMFPFNKNKNKKVLFDSDDEDDKTDDNKNKINASDDFEKFKKKLKKNSILIPDYIYDGLYFNENLFNKSEESKNSKTPKTLKEIWKDFFLYDNIIDTYRSNIWGIENVCKKVEVEYGGNPLVLSQKLIKKYSEIKKFKNILTKDIMKCLGIKNTVSISSTSTLNPNSNLKSIITSNAEDKDGPINVLKINLILLCVAIDITRDNDEKEFLVGYFQQFLIFCVLASINTSSSEKNSSKIQSKLYDILLFGFTFFQNISKSKFDKIFESLIKPIFDEINNEHSKKGFKGLFTKKNLFKNSALLKIFIPEDMNKPKEKEREDNFDEIDQEDELNSTMIVGYGYATDRRNVFRKGIASDMMYKDDTTISKKKKKIKYVLKNEDPKVITGKIFDIIITDYKNKRNRVGFNDIIKIFYKNIHPFKLNPKYADERARVNNVIKEIIPFFETNIKKYSNTYYLQEKKRRNELKKCKKELFSWKGFWSNRHLFFEHPELLKVKKKNHFTKEMTQPLLTPILDIDYYLPDFKKFDKSKLFNKNNFYYRINLNIDEILKEEIKKQETEEKNIIYKKNSFGFNYLECLYKLPYTGLWELYKYYHDYNFNLDKIIQKENNNNNYNYISLSESNSISSSKESNLINQEKEKDKEKETKIDKKNHIPTENTYHCCMVKLTHHIKGFLSTEERSIKFTYNNNLNILDELEDPNFDKDMGSCFGSIFKSHKKDKDKVDFKIDYLDIKYMFMRHYFYNESGIEIYTETNKSYYFNFKNNKDLSQFIYDIQHHSFLREIKAEDYKGRKSLGFESIPLTTKKKSYSINHKMEDWQNYNISTLEYLMWLNIYAGRSFNDLTQYPVFPWILTNYKTDSLNLKNDIRNLNIPMGMMEINDKSTLRKETFIDTYDSFKNDLIEIDPTFNYQEFLKKGDEYYDNYRNKKSKREKTMSMTNTEENIGPLDTNISKLQLNQIPYYYGSHYSNPTYISNYLSRTFPFSLVSIEIQGEKFDDPDRIFLSMQKTFESASSLKDDIRELIPEFYSLPEVFLNINNLNLSQGYLDSEGKQIIINDVNLPPWSKNKVYTFVAEMRKNLENSELKINKWVDLIFGNLQRGVGAEENHNIFMAHTYERMVKIDTIENADSRNALMRLFEVGVTPFQLFDDESKAKIEKSVFFTKNNIYSGSKDNFLEECQSVYAVFINSNKFNTINNNLYQNQKLTTYKELKQEISQKIAKIIFLSPNNLRIFTNTNYWYNLKYNLSGELKIEEESNFTEVENNSNKYAASYFISSIKTPIIIYSNNKYMIKGGFWDGRIEVNSLIHGPKEELYSTSIFPNCGPVTVMAMSKNESFLVCGTKLGVIIVFQVYDKNIIIKQKIFMHNDEITSIAVNDNLNMFASTSKDGYIMLHILPTCELVRAIKIKLINKKNPNNLYADNIFLSSSPIPVIVIYCSLRRIFKIYSINGLNINEKEEEDYSKYITCHCIYNNLDFQDFLIYGTDDGFVKIRKFPEMEILNSINLFDGEQIETLTISQDKRYCYVSGRNNQIGLIKDSSIIIDEQKTDNFGRIGYIKK